MPGFAANPYEVCDALERDVGMVQGAASRSNRETAGLAEVE
jgi:hypothetical protein